MTTLDVLTWLQDSALAHAISKTDHLVGAGLQIIHVMGLVALLASLVLISLHLLGLAFKHQPTADIAREATQAGVAGACADGVERHAHVRRHAQAVFLQPGVPFEDAVVLCRSDRAARSVSARRRRRHRPVLCSHAPACASRLPPGSAWRWRGG